MREFMQNIEAQRQPPAPMASVAPPGPIRPQAHYGAPLGAQFAPQRPPAAPGYMPAPAPPMGGFPAAPFAPPPAYPPAAPPPAYGPTAAGPFPRTGFDFTRLQAPAPQGDWPSTFLSPFVPVQPHKPLLIDDLLTVNAVNALKFAPNKLLIDNATGYISFQPDISGVSTRKIKRPDKIKCPEYQRG
jgi:hypothetical protein